jgi:hypothetical protein
MPKYTVHVRQWVEELAQVEVEADSPEEAAAKVEQADENDIDIDWYDGNDSSELEIVHVFDEEKQPQEWEP